uniref:Uncharacterized protein n=1 Tax=Helicotheca tamesis TaxID=374047 RepID=A0A6U0GQL9_9STRA|eukprot:CAMPEP_0185728364 /NCGR_PEP_ID=MMETSP1171-20130828/3730_1 /TAXON_ID=374046 /ORGANISM="Helicotheca tamensis, Strain CCMP826" /LENGTH=104 /DNA_ID=CAMNT_0028397065 /DNA_START=413 /DNA_END=727 /DNA_ORIENTATION=-
MKNISKPIALFFGVLEAFLRTLVRYKLWLGLLQHSRSLAPTKGNLLLHDALGPMPRLMIGYGMNILEVHLMFNPVIESDVLLACDMLEPFGSGGVAGGHVVVCD